MFLTLNSVFILRACQAAPPTDALVGWRCWIMTRMGLFMRNERQSEAFFLNPSARLRGVKQVFFSLGHPATLTCPKA